MSRRQTRTERWRKHSLARQHHESARDGILIHRLGNQTHDPRIVADGHHGSERFYRMSPHRVTGRRPPEARKSRPKGFTPEGGATLDLTAHKGALARSAPASPCPSIRMRSVLRAEQHFAIRLHHRQQNLLTGEYASSWNALQVSVRTPSKGNATWTVSDFPSRDVFSRTRDCDASPWWLFLFSIGASVLPHDR